MSEYHMKFITDTKALF